MSTSTPPPPGVDRHLSATSTAQILGDWRGSGPAYVALADTLRSAVLSGVIASRTRLPSERELAETLGVSRTTTAAAYRTLRERGVVRSRTGLGTVTALPRGNDRPRSTTGGDSPWDPVLDDTADDVIDLKQAAPSAPPRLHAAYARALERLPAHLTGIGYHPLGLEPLRATIARRYTERGTPTTPDQILVTSGAQHAIATLLGALAGRSDRVVVQSPTYAHALEAARAGGSRVVGLPVGRPGLDHAPGFDVDLFASTLRRTSPSVVYLVPDHHNPTGYSLTPQEREAVRDLARRHRTVVIGDETMTDLTLDGPPPEPFLADGADPAQVVGVGSASKMFWGGLRVGWIRTHPDLVAHLARQRERIDIGTSVLDQLTVDELLAEADAVLAERVPTIRAQRDTLVDGLRTAVPGWSVPRPPGGLSVWIDLGAPLAHALVARASGNGVLLTPGPALTPDRSGASFVRAAFAPASERLQVAVARLADAWAGLSPAVSARGSRPSR